MEGLLTLCFIALSTGTLLAVWFCKGKSKKQLPPGPWTLPIIGSLHHLIGALPHRKITELCRRHGPLMLLRLGEVTTVVVSSAEAAAQVMKSNDLVFASRPRSATLDIFGSGGKAIAFASYGDHWRQMRKICVMELLSSTQVKRMVIIRTEEMGSLLHNIMAAALTGTTINVSEKVMALSNDVVARAVFGGKFTQQCEYLRELEEALRLLGGFCPVDLFPSSRLVRWLSNGERHMKRSHGCMQRIIARIIDERRAARTAGGDGSIAGDEDMLDVLLRLQQEDSLKFPLTTEKMGAVLFDVFAGATETTGNVLAWAMSELMQDPRTMAKAQHEIHEVMGQNQDVITNSDLAKLHYIQMVIKETLRLHSPAPLIPCEAREDCIIMGYDIPKGPSVYINVSAICQDPTYWDYPEEFRPERFENNNVNYNGTNFEFIPFGAGRRQCPGIQFSSSVTGMALTNFLYHFDRMFPDGASLPSFDMSEKFGLAVSRRYDLQLRVIPHMWSNRPNLYRRIDIESL